MRKTQRESPRTAGHAPQKNSPYSLSTVSASRPRGLGDNNALFCPRPHTITPPENRGPYRPAIKQVEVAFYLPGF
jgi:hypothetical protein